jgi:hypothetical protein
MLASHSACLVTADPDFTGPKPTRPLLIESPLTPSGKFIESVKLDGSYPTLTFHALVLSEDAGREVEVLLALNYGGNKSSAGPADDYPDKRVLSSSTLAAGPRVVSLNWTPPDIKAPDDRKCNSITMYATHQLINEGELRECPASPDDVTSLSWFVALCGASASECSYDDCPGAAGEVLTYCENLELAP